MNGAAGSDSREQIYGRSHGKLAESSLHRLTALIPCYVTDGCSPSHVLDPDA